MRRQDEDGGGGCGEGSGNELGGKEERNEGRKLRQ